VFELQEESSTDLRHKAVAQSLRATSPNSHKTHYRIVFEEKGVTIDNLSNVPEVMKVLGDIATALQLLKKLNWVHRDVSIGNILSYNGCGKLADLEYAKRMGDKTSHDMRTASGIQFVIWQHTRCFLTGYDRVHVCRGFGAEISVSSLRAY